MAESSSQKVIAMKKIACVGILVADVMTGMMQIPEPGKLAPVSAITVHNGGNAMTAAVNLKKLGVDSAVIGMVGEDLFGNFLVEKLLASGVDIRGLKTCSETQTSVSVVLNDRSGERSFLHCKGANAVFSEKDIDDQVIGECDAVFVTGTFLLDAFDGEETMRFLKQCKALGKTTFLDVCWDASGQWGELLDCSLPYIDYFMPSIDEAVCLAKEETSEKIADVFIQKGVKNVIIKLGRRGSFFRKAGEPCGQFFPACQIGPRVDTTGAGDSFCSGFLAAFARGKSDEECMAFANAVGACCVSAKGATAEIRTYEETEKLMKSERKGEQ